MDETDRRIRLVLVLATLTSGPKRVHSTLGKELRIGGGTCVLRRRFTQAVLGPFAGWLVVHRIRRLLSSLMAQAGMVFDQLEQARGTRFLFTLALAVILVHGLRLMQPIILPFLVASFLAIICLPMMIWLKRKGAPGPLAIFLTVMVVAGAFVLLIVLASQQLAEIQDRFPRYQSSLQAVIEGWTRAIEARWEFVAAARPSYSSFLNLETLVPIVGGTFQRALSFLSNTFLVFLILIFALGEASVFPAKLRAILGDGASSDARFQKIIQEVQAYLGIKTIASLTTGTLLGIWCWALGLDSPLLLGLIAFALNYVPTIGSILSAGPALALAVIQYDIRHVFYVLIGYVAVNIVIGNWLEPTLLGRRLGLSTLVVILSLVFWGWLWGPIGALLSVPLTMVIKIMLENTQDLRWIAVLLDKSVPAGLGAEVGSEAS